jgi:hypothetical protein
LGADTEYVAGLGFETIGFDISDTAIQLARARFTQSAVRYQRADLLEPPDGWLRAFDLVVEVITVQALPDPPRRQAIVNVGALVAPGGTLLAIAAASEDGTAASRPPWPLTRSGVELFASAGLEPVCVERLADPQRFAGPRWRAEFRRPPEVRAR